MDKAKKIDQYLRQLPRISDPSACGEHSGKVFLLPSHVDFCVNDATEVRTIGLSPKLDAKVLDLINIIEIDNALDIQYRETDVLTPLVYAESLPDILWHITTQAILFVRVSENALAWIDQTHQNARYGMHPMDQFWLSCSKPLEQVCPGELLCVFNRRVGGWDGSKERPVIELLGAGGHLPTVWDDAIGGVRTLGIKENLQKEMGEELGIDIDDSLINVFGGYVNQVTHELVILAGIELDESLLPMMQGYAIQNIDADTMGIYMGSFNEVMDYYRNDPSYFAGGVRTAPCNFPNQRELMDKVDQFILKMDICKN